VVQDEPTVGELLEAVAELLADEIMPVIDDGVLEFRIRVALNAIGIVRRELELGADALELERQRLISLLPESAAQAGADDLAGGRGDARRQVERLNEMLVERIQARRPPDGLFDHLVQTDLERLSVASPKYLARLLPEITEQPGI
jgi:cytochrome P450